MKIAPDSQASPRIFWCEASLFLDSTPMDAALQDSLQAIEASLSRIAGLLEVIADALLVEADPDAEDVGMSLDGPVNNAVRDQTRPL